MALHSTTVDIRDGNDNASTSPHSAAASQTKPVAHEATLTRPSARNSHYSIGGDDAVDVSHHQELWTSSLYWCWWSRSLILSYTREPRQCFQLTEHALHLRAVAARFGWKQRSRAARVEAARAGGLRPLLDSNGVTLFFVQYYQNNCCRLPPQQ